DFPAPLGPATLAIVLGGGLAGLATLGALGRAVRTVGPRPAAWLPLLLLALPLCCAVVDGRAAVGAMSIAVLFVLLYAGLPVAFALLAAAALGIGVIKGDAMIAVSALGLAAGGAVSSYVFAAVPLFVLMGLVVGRADIGRDSLEAAEWLLGRVVGGLGIATVAANAVFAAITGISIASASIFGKVAVPPLVEQGYTARYAVGLVAGSSVLGMLIPPSLLLIVYGLIAEVSINRLFVAAVAPGVILTVLFAGMTAFAAWRRLPFAVTAALRPGRSTAFGARGAARRAAPIAGMIAAVLGGIYAGVFTPTEAGAVGALLALGAALLMRRVSARALGALLLEAAAASSSLLFLIVAASAFGMMLTLSGIPTTMGELAAAAGLGLGGYVLLYVLLLIVLGTVLDSTSILLIMVPLALPTVAALGGDLVWFGIVNVIGVEVGLLTPPLGLSVFAIKAALDDQSITLNEIFLGALPFVVAMLLLLGLLIAAPGVSTFLL
ncbi:MAG: TRAP transporter large permease, partial [Gammaproteobacteria bacterium]